jgi:hypothetical protein
MNDMSGTIDKYTVRRKITTVHPFGVDFYIKNMLLKTFFLQSFFL